jgi:hypothetical protein
MLPFSVAGKNQMAARLAGLSDGENSGKMVAFGFRAERSALSSDPTMFHTPHRLNDDVSFGGVRPFLSTQLSVESVADHGIVKVTGSIPVRSTNVSKTQSAILFSGRHRRWLTVPTIKTLVEIKGLLWYKEPSGRRTWFSGWSSTGSS